MEEFLGAFQFNYLANSGNTKNERDGLSNIISEPSQS